MEINNEKSEFNYDQVEDKHFFASYFNMATKNIYRVLNDCQNRFKVEVNKLDLDGNLINNQEKIESILELLFPNNLGTYEFEERIKYLTKILPFIQHIYLPSSSIKLKGDVDRQPARIKYFKTSLLVILRSFLDISNAYNHYYNHKLDFEYSERYINNKGESIYHLLDSILLTCACIVFKKKKKATATKKELNKKLEAEIYYLKQLKREKLAMLKERDPRVIVDEESINNAIFNGAFRDIIHKKYGKNQLQIPFQSRQYYENSIVPISKNAFVFFLCLFLDNKQGYQLRDSIYGFKKTKIRIDEVKHNYNSLTFHTKHWVYNELAFKGIKERLKPTFDKESLLYQIVEYLGKIPNEMFQLLSENHKNEFISNVDVSNNIFAGEKEIDTIKLSIGKRFENKFNYFVLKFLDKYVFNKIKLQIVLGKYTHHQQEKKLFGTQTIIHRIIDEKIKVFGNLNEIKKIKNDYFDQNTAKKNDFHLEEMPNPYYNINDNKIPIYFESKKNKLKNSTSSRKVDKIDKIKIVEKIKDIVGSSCDIITDSPTAILSLNELPALLHHFFTQINGIDKNDNAKYQKIVNDLENKIIKKFDSIFDSINDYDQKNADISNNIPKSFKISSPQTEIDYAKLSNVIQNEIHTLNDKLETIQTLKYQNKEKKRYFKRDTSIFTEKILKDNSNWLAKELIRCMPVENRKKWKGFHHTHLRYCLSVFRYNKTETYSILNNCWEFDRQMNDHLSLAIRSLIIEERGIERLYESYIKIKRRELESLHDFIGNNTPENINSHPILWRIFKKKDFTTDSLPNLKQKILEKPILLPRGIFDDKPTYIKGKSIASSPEEFASWLVYLNEPHEYQAFYIYKKNYDFCFFNQKLDYKTIQNNKKLFDEIRQRKYFEYKYDKKVKNIQYQDLFLKDIVNFILSDVSSSSENNFTLKDFYQYNHNKLADEENKLALNPIWNSKIMLKKKQFNDEIELKDFEKFKNLFKDDKIQKIFSYNEKKNWSWNELIRELVGENPDSYENIRIGKLFRLIHGLEKQILDKYDVYKSSAKHPEELEIDNQPNFNNYMEFGLKNKKIDKKVKELLIKIRNSYNNNDLLDKEDYLFILKKTGNTKGDTVSNVIYTFVFNELKDIIIKINPEFATK